MIGLALVAEQRYSWAQSQQLSWSMTIGVPLYAPGYLDEDSVVTYFDMNWRFW